MNKIDLIIPTHNRTDYLKRLLDYYQANGLDFNFIIADSSNSANKARNKRLILKYSNLNILYLDKFPEKLEQHYKFAQMVKYINSKYCVFCADDDFVIPNAIRECIDFLEKNPDYSAAHGTYISFYVQNNFLGSKRFHWRFLFSPKSIDSQNPTNRLTSHLTNYILVLWAVRKTSVVKNCYKEFLKVKIDPYLYPIFGELIPDVLTVIFGKIKNLNTFYGARQYLSQIRGNYPSLIDAKREGKYSIIYSNFKRCILRILQDKDADNIIDAAMENYIKYSYQEHLVNKTYSLLNKTPKFISQGLRMLHTNYLFSKKTKNKIGLINQPTSKYFEDFNKIRQIAMEQS